MNVSNFKYNYEEVVMKMFVGRESELNNLNELYLEKRFHLYIIYGRRRVGKTTLINEFCKGKDVIFYSAEQSNDKMNLEKFSDLVYQFYGENDSKPFDSWVDALLYINNRQKDKRLILVFDEFPYLVRKNRSMLSGLQHLIDHVLKDGMLFMILCGSYMGFMEKEVLGAKSPIFGRRTAQLRMKPFTYNTAIRLFDGFSNEDKLKLYGALGGTPLYLSQIKGDRNFEDNIKNELLSVNSYLYEEPQLLLRQEVNEPGVYSAIIESIACGAAKANEISTKVGEESAKCIKYINHLCELGILHKEIPYGEKHSSRKTIYRISDFMFRFWYRYVSPNRTLLETGAKDTVWSRKVEPDYNDFMGLAFEMICKEYLLIKNSRCELPILFTSIGRWWGTDSHTHKQEEIDIIAGDKNDFLICECKWKNEKTDLPVLKTLMDKADIFNKNRNKTWYVLFSKSGFTEKLVDESKKSTNIILVNLDDIVNL